MILAYRLLAIKRRIRKQARDELAASKLLRNRNIWQKHYRQGQASEIMLKTLRKLFDYETETCGARLRQLRNDLSDFEKRYEMTSEIFWQRFQEGKTDDRMDFVEWASLVRMTHRLAEKPMSEQ